MKKVLSLILIFLMLFALNTNAAEVTWSEAVLKSGSLSAKVYSVEEGDMVSVAVYKGDSLVSTGVKIAESDTIDVPVDVTGGDYARVFVWGKDSLEPKSVVTSRLTPDGVSDNAIFSDNQQSNRVNAVAGYKSFDAVSGEYMIKINITVVEKGDNAILIGDSSNGTLSYGTSSVTLLFSGDNFAVRNGNGEGAYTANATALCEAETNKTYEIVFKGNVGDNTYQVIITDGKNRYTSETIHARKNAAALDTIALVSNSRNTTVKNGCYSDFAFYGKDLQIITNPDDMVLDPVYVYEGFEGLYYGLMVDGKYVRGNNGKLTYDYDTVKDNSAMFIPRDMGDGSHAFVCRSSNNRMTTPSTILQNLTSSAYAVNDNSQHWILEKSENYSEDNLSFYIKHMDNNYYIGKALIGNNLTLRQESSKVEVTFVPLYDYSPLYLVSLTQSYNNLTDRQRYMLESVYESVAGDIFGRYGGYTEWTPRIRMDNMFNEILSGGLTESAQLTKLNEFLNDTNGFIYLGQASYDEISTAIPGTEGLYAEIDGGVAGTYDFWRGTMLEGVLYKYSIYTAEGELEQTINLYVQNDGTAQTNAATFKRVILQIPYIFRQHLKNVKVRSDSANSYNGGGSDMYIRLNWAPNEASMRSTVVHELGHIIDTQNGNWSTGAGWVNARAQDMFTPSEYGATTNAEDFAEFARMYFEAYTCKDRQRGLAIIMPERYASFGRLRKNNMAGWGLWEDEYTS